ncbi:MAG: AAA family ATPase [Planctomycetota bacterium]|nr:MAG: AAA family ATPase [Planctomycetota bacterium]
MLDVIDRLRANIAGVFLGDPAAVDRVIACLLARGHVLIEDVPGVGKTILATALARSVDCSFNRIQLTPDLLPGDVLGVSIYNRQTERFEFKPGPIFANIVLADEINRASPKTQSALLEAMNEATVSSDGVIRRLEPPFMVVATQNPADFEGAYPLPESQLDRFLMRLGLGYPTPEREAEVLDLRPAGAVQDLAPAISRQEVLALQDATDAVRLDPSLAEYIVSFARATREHEELRIGLSPRGALALAQAARATAVMDGRDYCIPEDITSNVRSVCAHRLLPSAPVGAGRYAAADRVIEDILECVEAPG